MIRVPMPMLDAEHSYPRVLQDLAAYVSEPLLPALTRQFLHDQMALNDSMPLPKIISPISVFHSASATFYAPSDLSGTHGVCHEIIRSTPLWRRKDPRRDCVLIVEDNDKPGMRGMIVGRVKLFFSFAHEGQIYPCALIERFSRVGCGPDPNTGMWKVKPLLDRQKNRVQMVEHLDVIFWSAHLIPVFGDGPLPDDFHFSFHWMFSILTM
jgi:hypothetical protein